MRILIAGSEGSLMQSVIPLLLAEGHEVIGVDKISRQGESRWRRAYEFVRGDLCDKEIAARMCRRADAVIQAAASVYGVRGLHEHPADILALDIDLHQNLLWGSLRSGISRVVYVSSSMVYERCRQFPLREEDLDDTEIPRTDYGLSKLVGERLCRAFHMQYSLDYTIWRPFNIMTPHEQTNAAQGIAHVFTDFLQSIVVERRNPLSILGDGEQVRCFTWIGDVASAIARYSFDARTRCEAFNLANPEPVTIKRLAQMIFLKAQRRNLIAPGTQLRLVHSLAYDTDVRFRLPSIEKAERVLGWKPAVTLNEALDWCIDAVASRDPRVVKA